MRTIKFIREHFDLNGNHIASTEWGVYPGVFKGPTHVSGQNTTKDRQFTGLNDKNGKEIYEGDIVKCWNGNKSFICSNGWAWCIGKNKRIIQEYERFEIIGNIYENSDLLK